MKHVLSIVAASAVLAFTSGCAVYPARASVDVAVPVGVAYVAPTYVSPGVGYVWAYHPHYGWGWHHPVYGWHAGWR